MIKFLFFILIVIIIFLIIKIIKIQRDLVRKESLLIRQAKLASVGEMLEHIAHQWKQPLAQINSIVLNIELDFEDGKLDKESLENELNQIEKLTHFMSQTIESFRNYLHPDKERSTFSIKEALDECMVLIEPLLRHKKIAVYMDVDQKCLLSGYKKEFIQTLLVILNNAKDALIQNKIKDPYIKIEVKKRGKKIHIRISDNGGGIDERIMDKIFEPYFTTKIESKGTGHGLCMAKMIVEDSLKGKINAYNIKDGACFEIVI